MYHIQLLYLPLLWLILVQSFSIDPLDTRSVTARVFGSLADVNEFIGDDPAFYYLGEQTEVLDAGYDSEKEDGLQELVAHLESAPVRQQLEEMTVVSLNTELEQLNSKLEVIYQKLLDFAEVLASLTDEDFISMGEKLLSNPEYYEKVMKDEIDPLSLFSEWDHTTSNNIDNIPISATSNGKSEIIQEVLIAEDGVIYWNPDADYDMIEKHLVNDSQAVTKLDELIETTGIIKLLKKKLKKVKLIFSLLLKLFKFTKVLKLKEVKTCLKIMKTIEKIKKCLMLIKSVLIKKLKKFIKGFPSNVLLKIKLVIALIMKIVKKLLWEIKYVVIEILIKLYYFFNKLEKVPFVIKVYFKQEIYERLGGEDHNLQEAWDDFAEWNELLNEGWRDYNDIETVYNDDLQYTVGSGNKPEELDIIFRRQFTAKEYKELERDDFNHEVIYAIEDVNDEAGISALNKRDDKLVYLVENETSSTKTFNISIHGNLTLDMNVLESLKNVNATIIQENQAGIPKLRVEISSGTLSYDTWILCALPIILGIFTGIFIT